jgi:3-isopropylmalate/(R)-2-methylmalate dehydratase large subunit
VYAKDAALALTALLGADGANYQALEFAGVALALDDRLVLANMSVEMGAKNGIFPGAVAPDDDAVYARQVVLELDRLAPQVALPHRVNNVAPISSAAGTPVHMVHQGLS